MNRPREPFDGVLLIKRMFVYGPGYLFWYAAIGSVLALAFAVIAANYKPTPM